YYTAGLRILTSKSNNDIQGPDDLKDKVVATRLGTTGYRYVTFVQGVKQVIGYPDIDDAIKALEKGEADAVVFDGPVVSYHMKSAGKNRMRLAGSILTKEQYGIVLSKGSLYTGRINNALDEIGKNGTYEKLYRKWFKEKPK